ncbi:hypothetical protein [Streptomyces sp. WAC 01529]|uniref:hypothetical protein n=1 Tax=Streptomyces sp. WAC 01529 TaxID=2203205 RepID=UPI0013DF4CE3|nr:hypothetical protein [Streptomyces sp. WAC 01529]
MNRTKKALVTLALAVAAAGAAAGPAAADGHMPAAPQGADRPVVTPLGDSHIPAPPQG